MTEDQIQTIGKLADKFEYDNVYGEALRAALTLAGQTCSSCKHSREWPDKMIGCMNPNGLNRDEVSPSDGCRLGWEAK